MEDKELLEEFRAWSKARAEEEAKNIQKGVWDELKGMSSTQEKLEKKLTKYKREITLGIKGLGVDIEDSHKSIVNKIENLGTGTILDELKTHFDLIEKTLLSITKCLRPASNEMEMYLSQIWQIQWSERNGRIVADSKLLPGTPNIGEGQSREEALLSLVVRTMKAGNINHLVVLDDKGGE